MISFRQLLYFARIVELGSMSKAADSLNVAQTALGTQVRLLEDELKTTLLRRHSRGVAITPAGELVRARAVEILDLVNKCVRDVEDLTGGETQALAIGASGSVVQLAAADFLARAHSAMPDVAVSLVEDTSVALADAFGRNELDLLLAHEVPDQPGASCAPWLREELLFVSSPLEGMPGISTAGELTETITLEEALQKELALPARLDGIRKIIAAVADERHLTYSVPYKVQSHQALKLMMIADNNVASVLPYGLVSSELRAGSLRARRILGRSISRTLYACRSSRRLAMATEATLEKLLDEMRSRMIAMLGPLAVAV
jgi:LysR family nitrogen assimilation transcriptional regulator